jgi:hypothetical protein
MTCILKSLWPLNANTPLQSRHLAGFSNKCRLVLFVISTINLWNLPFFIYLLLSIIDRDLFGINTEPDSHKNHLSAFERLIRAILLIEVGKTRELDFRAFLIKKLIWCSIEAMRSRFTDNNEIKLMVRDTRTSLVME